MSGHAVNCQRLKMRDAENVYKEIEIKLKENYPNLQFCGIGSLGKKAPDAETGDIDIAVVIDSKEKLKDILNTSIGYCIKEINMNTTPKVMSISYSTGYCNEKYEDIYAQVDFMLVDNLEWAKWRFQSPDLKNGESKYKADPKVFLQSYMVSAIPLDMPVEYFEDGETVHIKYKYTLNQEGLYIQKLDYLGKRGKPVKTPTRENYKYLGNNPKTIMKLIFPTECIMHATPDVLEILNDDYITEKFVEKAFHSVEGLWKLLHKAHPYGVNYVKDVEERFYKEYVNNPRSECQLDPNDFPCMYYKVA